MGPRGATCVDLRTELAPASRLPIDIQQMRTDEHGRGSILASSRRIHRQRHAAHVRMAVADTPREQIHVADELVDERGGRPLVDLLR